MKAENAYGYIYIIYHFSYIMPSNCSVGFNGGNSYTPLIFFFFGQGSIF